MKHAWVWTIGAVVIVLSLAGVNADAEPDSAIMRGRTQTVLACEFDRSVCLEEYWLTTDSGDRYRLEFDAETSPPDAGARVEITGEVHGHVVIVETVEIIGAPLGGNPTTGEQRICVLLINFLDDQRENVSPQLAYDMFFDPVDSADSWWRGASFNKMWATGDVFGWYTLPMNRDCDPFRWRDLAIAAADPDVDFTQYNRLFLLMPEGGGCGWGGLGTLGTEQLQTNDGPWITSTAWCRSEYYNWDDPPNVSIAIMITTHEGGHNLGQHHARAIEFSGEALGPFDCNACDSVVTEYGDRLDTLGLWNLGSYNAHHKINLGWLNDGNLLAVTNNGTYSIDAFEVDSAEPKVLDVFRGHGANTHRNERLYLEWRQPIGYDAGINWLGGVNYDGVLMHYDWDEPGTATYMLDMTPGDGELLNPVLRTGNTWTDNYTDLSITALGAQNNHMMVDITFDAALTGVQATTGILLDGDLLELDRSDDLFLHARSGFGPTIADLHKLDLVVTAHTNRGDAEFVDLTIESRISEAAGTAQTRLLNQNSGSFDLVDLYSIGPTDASHTIRGFSAADYVDGSGDITVAIRHLVFVPFVAFTFESWFNTVEFRVH